MTPMIDIVFLLIIFFLVSSHMARQENRQPVTLAQADSGQLDDIDSAPLTLTLDAAGKFFFGSESISVGNLPARLAAYRRHATDRQVRARSSEPPRVSVRLRVDRSVRYGDVEPILKELAEQGVAEVAIVVSPRDATSPRATVP